MNEQAQEFLFIDQNDPGVWYHGTIAHMEGLALEGGKPERSYTYTGQPGDSVKTKNAGYWPVEKAPWHWFEACVKQGWSRNADADGLSMIDAWALGLGDCIYDVLTDADTTYPRMKWCTTHIMQKDRDLVFMVPVLECDPYGRVTEALGEPSRIRHTKALFVEDTTGQDHLRAYHFNGTWVHRTDLVGLERGESRMRIVKPVQQALSDSLPDKNCPAGR